jgi:methionyl-tRNA formyltransferase
LKNNIDLLLGGDLGLWALQQVSTSSIGQVFTLDDDIAEVAQNLGVMLWKENANATNFTPSKVGLSVHYPKILKKDFISRYRKIYNLHPGFLPWGRGYYPIFWALWEQTPAGATLHEITEGVDEGPVVAQKQVEYYPYDTGGLLFQRVREAEKDLFLEYWPKIVEGARFPSTFSQSEGGTYHSKKEFFELKKSVDWESMNGKDLLRLVQCLTFSGYPGLEIVLGGKGFEVRLERMRDT